jgi:integrase
MKLPVKPICEQTFVRRDGTSIIFLQYCYNREQRTLLNTEIAIPPQYWNRRQLSIARDLPKEFGHVEELNAELQRMIRTTEDIILFAERNKIKSVGAFVKETFHPCFKSESLLEKQKEIENRNPRKNLDLFFQIDDYIKSKEGKVCKDMPRIYKNMKFHLEEFQEYRNEKITFDSLDFEFYERFVDFLANHYVQKRSKNKTVGLKTNTVGKTIKQFRTFLRNRIRKRIISPIDMEGWTILEDEVDAVYLQPSEISLIEKVDLQEYPHLTVYKEYFVLGCLTGLRFSDFSKLDEYDVRDGFIFKKQQKSDHRVVIPLRPRAKEILETRTLASHEFPTNAEFNRHIKTLCQLAGLSKPIKHSYKKGNKKITEVRPKYAWVTSHTCRRSFCTNEFLAGTPVELIMKISGHKSVKDFYKYIRIAPEEASMKIKQLWIERGEMSA